MRQKLACVIILYEMSFLNNIKKVFKNPRFALLFIPVELLNFIVGVFSKSRMGGGESQLTDIQELGEVRKYARTVKGAIGDHLTTLFIESLLAKPKLIVELGVRGGDSTYVLECVAKMCKAYLVSVDIDDFNGDINYEKWEFVRADDLKLAKDFGRWCKKRKIKPTIDVLFIDTSHYFDHTREEIKAWFPFLSTKARVFFHDTNLRTIYPKKDGRFGVGWNNKRGVIRALEDYLGKTFNERVDFIDIVGGWLVRHTDYSGGFTTLLRVDVK